MKDSNKVLTEEDKEQLEYINKWWEKKRAKQKKKLQKKLLKRKHLNFAKTYLRCAMKELINYFDCAIK